LIGDNSPAGSKLTENPTKESDKKFDYTWNKKWKDIENDTEYIYDS
jgi:hypothetical protein